MKYIYYYPLIGFVLFIALLTGLIAQWHGQHHLAWFAIVLMPLLTAGCVHYIRHRQKRKAEDMCALPNENLFDHLFIVKNKKAFIPYRKYLK